MRTVFLKGPGCARIRFFINLESRKARQISENPNVSLVFPWLALQPQVIVSGFATKISVAETLKCFVTRRREHPCKAARFHGATSSKWNGNGSSGDLVMARSLPSFWGGYRVIVHTIEFWQGGRDRVHDRFEYTHQPDGSWTIERLAP